ncbi:MAG: helix-turn-helix domain-containing protein [Gemmataceae bacterium]|nr:helix-turn-helix domain-containing protein [Gemmataceae bacterium]
MEKSLDQRFGEALRALREAAGKTQENFAGIARTYLSELERGLKTPTLETIVRLSSELGVSPTRLVELATTSESGGAQPETQPLSAAMNSALSLAAEHNGGQAAAAFTDATPLSVVGIAAAAAGIKLPHLLAEAALVAFRSVPGRSPRGRRRRLRFVVADKRPPTMLRYAQDGRISWSFSPEAARRALEKTNLTLELADDVLGMNGIPFYELLGTRNLGSFVGAVYGYSLQLEMPDKLIVNGHQDGYPDLCALTKDGKAYIEKVRAEGMGDAKKSWASYPYGGIEIKTTCGAVPTPTKTRKKPGIGDERSNQLTGADWKAHHRETNRLLGLFWDFIDRVPTVIGLFYRNDLSEADWGEVIVPTTDDATVDVGDVEEGMDGEVVVEMAIESKPKKKRKKKKAGRTTSVSIMTGTAVKKMGKGWIVLPSDPELLKALGKPRIFDLGLAEIEPMTSSLPTDVRTVLQNLDDEKKQQQQVVVAKAVVKPSRKK